METDFRNSCQTLIRTLVLKTEDHFKTLLKAGLSEYAQFIKEPEKVTRERETLKRRQQVLQEDLDVAGGFTGYAAASGGGGFGSTGSGFVYVSQPYGPAASELDDARRRSTASARSEAEPRKRTAYLPPTSSAARSRPPRPPPPLGRRPPALPLHSILKPEASSTDESLSIKSIKFRVGPVLKYNWGPSRGPSSKIMFSLSFLNDRSDSCVF